MLAHALADLRYAGRQMLKTPGFTAVAVLTMALGIGASSAIFSVVNGVLLRPLPYPDAGALVRVYEVVPQYGRFSVAPANFLDWRAQNGVFERIAAFTGGSASWIGPEGPERLTAASVSWDVFEVLGVPPAQGRGFREEEDAPGGPAVVMISHGLWQRRLGGDPAVLGQTMTLSGTPATIVGVMPAGFYFPNRDTELWRPLALPAEPTRGGHYLGVIARLRPGVGAEQAGAEMQGIAARLATAYPDNNRDESAEVQLLGESIVGNVRPMLLTLLAAVGVVILIACANVANLLLVRASVREKEIAIRTAMGAGRRRLVLQMLTESLVLSLAGGAVGLLLAWLAIGPIQTLGASSIPRVADVALDRNVLLFALGVSVLTGILFGLAPAWQAGRGGPSAVLKEGGRSSVSGGGRRLRSALLVAEVALSIVLLVGAALLLRSFASLTRVDPGFRPENVLAFQVALPSSSYADEPSRAAFYDRLLERLEAAPGVESAGMSHMLPMRGGYVLSFVIEGRPTEAGRDESANYRVVSPRYLDTAGIPLLRGRGFTGQDHERAPMVAIVDEAFVARHFPGADAIGERIDIGNGTDGFYEIVGVAGSVHHEGLDAAPGPTMYVPFKQDVFSSMWMFVRTAGDPSAFGPTARRIVAGIDGTLPAFSMSPLAEVVSNSVAERRFSMLLLALFAGVALALAAVGLYGIVSYSVRQRTQEIGVRMAVGAQRSDVLRLIVGDGMKLAALGVVVGLAGALLLARTVASMLFEVTPFDPVSYAATCAVLLAVAALACYLPARRAMAVDPLTALRQE